MKKVTGDAAAEGSRVDRHKLLGPGNGVPVVAQRPDNGRVALRCGDRVISEAVPGGWIGG